MCIFYSSELNAQEKNVLLNSLFASAERGVMFGHHDDVIYGEDWLDGVGVNSDIYELCGLYPKVLSLDLSPIETGSVSYTRHCTFLQQRQCIIEHYKRGGIVTLSWHLYNPLTRGSAWDVSNDSAVKAILRKGGVQNHFFHYLDLAADYLLTLRDKQGKLIPIIFRPFHDPQGSWFWWGKSSCSSKEYIKLWKLTRNYLTNKGCTHLLYCFSVSGVLHTRSEYLERFPGKKYVDVLGTEIYLSNEATIDVQNRNFMGLMQQNLSVLDSLSKKMRKPMAVTECGINGNKDPKWWSKCLVPSLQNYKVSYITFWANQHPSMLYGKGKTYCTYKGEVSSVGFIDVVRKNKLILLVP